LLALLLLPAMAVASDGDSKLWYAKPAQLEADWKYPPKPDTQTKGWPEALPIGSGRLGAMVFGGVGEERVQFNEDTLWTGKPHDYVRDGAKGYLDDIRKAAFANLADGSDEEKALVKL